MPKRNVLHSELDRGLMLLETVGQSSRPVPLPDLTAVLGIDSSSVYRLANTLNRRGFLAQVPGGYVLGAQGQAILLEVPVPSTVDQNALHAIFLLGTWSTHCIAR